jgi:alpha-mannosidase
MPDPLFEHKPWPRLAACVIGYGHTDLSWLWPSREGYAAAHATFRTALALMDEYPWFYFYSGPLDYLDYVARFDPDMFAGIVRRVHEGRWIPAAAWQEADNDILLPESQVRQRLTAHTFNHAHFGRAFSVDCNPDAFGHTDIWQIQAGSGISGFVFTRPHPHQLEYPGGRLFRMQAANGFEVLGAQLPNEYCAPGGDITFNLKRNLKELKPPHSLMLIFYGVGNHGGGPTRENLDSILALQAELGEDPDGPQLVFDSLEAFFAEARRRMAAGWWVPAVPYELHADARGCWANDYPGKKEHRRAELGLLDAEIRGSLAYLATQGAYPYPAQGLEAAWRRLCNAQFHDWICGTCTPSALQEFHDLLSSVNETARAEADYALLALAGQIAIQPHGQFSDSIVVFNPNAAAATSVVEMELQALNDDDQVLDEEDRPVPVQLLDSEAACFGRCRAAIELELPSLGYRTLRIARRTGQKREEPGDCMAAGPAWLENGRWRLELDPASRQWQLYHKETGRRLLADALCPAVYRDTADTWAHDTAHFEDRIGEFALVPESLHLAAHGSLKSTLRAEYRYAVSRLALSISTYRSSDVIEVEAAVDWREEHKMLKFTAVADLSFFQVAAQTPFGQRARSAQGHEEPLLLWMDGFGTLRGTQTLAGVGFISTGMGSYHARVEPLLQDPVASVVPNKKLGWTALRSPLIAHHVPRRPDPGAAHEYMDQGKHKLRFALVPHLGYWQDAGLEGLALAFNRPPVTLLYGAANPAGRLPLRGSFLEVDRPQVVLWAMKRAEDGRGTILRLYNSLEETHAGVTIGWGEAPRRVSLDFGAHEAVTLYVPDDSEQAVVRTDLMEVPLGEERLELVVPETVEGQVNGRIALSEEVVG